MSTYAEAWNDLGIAYFRQHRVPEAVLALRRATALAPESDVLAHNLRVALAEMQRLQTAQHEMSFGWRPLAGVAVKSH